MWATELYPHIEIEMDGHVKSYIYAQALATLRVAQSGDRQSEDMKDINNSTAECFEI